MDIICPYLGVYVPDAQMTADHVFPHAIGGGLDYSIRVSKKANDTIGTKLEKKLVDSPLIQALRLVYGIRSRKGEPAWECRAIHIPTGRPATITFRATETGVEIHDPITRSADNQHVNVLCSPEQDERILKQFLAGQADRGRLVKLIEEIKLPGQYRVEAEIDAGLISRAMLKIALGAAYERLGDAIVSDPVIIKCREALFSDERDALKRLEIPGFAFESPDHPAFLPKIAEYEHMAVVANVQLSGLVVGVQLFGGGFHSLFVVLSDQSCRLLDACHGTIAICDARTRHTRRLDFYEHQLRVCGLIPENDSRH